MARLSFPESKILKGGTVGFAWITSHRRLDGAISVARGDVK